MSFMNDYSDHIVSTPGILAGKPRVKGTRIPVQQVLQCLSEGWSMKKIIDQFPSLSKEDIQACVAYANEVMDNFKIVDFPRTRVKYA